MEKDKVTVEKSEVKTTISLLGDKENSGVKLAAKLEVTIENIDDEKKHEYVKKAHRY